MKRWTNYHSHTIYSDGSHSPEHYIASAIEKGMFAYGFSGHAPVPFTTDWTIKPEILADYFQQIDRLKAKYAGEIRVHKSLEVDFIPGNPMCWDSTLKTFELDYVIGSIHFVGQFGDGSAWNIDYNQEFFDKGLHEIFGGDVKQAVKKFFELSNYMVEEMRPDIIGHLDKMKMFCASSLDENETWYRDCVFSLLSLLQESGTIIEINTRGVYKGSMHEFYPSNWILAEIQRMGLPVTISSDSHHPSELINGFDSAAELLSQLGFKTLSVLTENGWEQKPFTLENGIDV